MVNLVQMNTPRVVMQETKKAFRKLQKTNDLQAVIQGLCNVKGVGPAMASGELTVWSISRSRYSITSKKSKESKKFKNEICWGGFRILLLLGVFREAFRGFLGHVGCVQKINKKKLFLWLQDKSQFCKQTAACLLT